MLNSPIVTTVNPSKTTFPPMAVAKAIPPLFCEGNRPIWMLLRRGFLIPLLRMIREAYTLDETRV
jgi:hypothetical protein